MFDSLKKVITGNSDITVGDALIAEAGCGEFEAEDLIMGSISENYEEEDEDEDTFEDEFFEGLGESGKRSKKEDDDEIERLVESVNVDEEDDAANEYLDSIAGTETDGEISDLVDKIPVDETGEDGVSTGIDDKDLEKASSTLGDPTIEELAEELDEEVI